MTGPENVTVEFLGIPRQRAGRAELAVAAETIADALLAVQRSCQGFTDLMRTDGQLAPQYALSLNGKRFLRDMDYLLAPGDRLLVISADAGG
ncbi:MAG TPA: MoaD/ThiS family protein [Gemmataceae bacterium]|jgi:molybdopterin converting factor small subunit|nr:MoaD/ThiS family protein [Gemmataceae bacterium]